MTLYEWLTILVAVAALLIELRKPKGKSKDKEGKEE